MTTSSITPPPVAVPGPADDVDQALSAVLNHIAHEPVPERLKISAVALQDALDAAGKPLNAAAGKA